MPVRAGSTTSTPPPTTRAYTNGAVTERRLRLRRPRLHPHHRPPPRLFGPHRRSSTRRPVAPSRTPSRWVWEVEGLVRGYFLADGRLRRRRCRARDTLNAPKTRILSAGSCPLSLSPYAFLDLGYARNEGAGEDVRLASIGAGTRLQLGPALAADLDVSLSLSPFGTTRVGAWRLEAAVTVAY